MTFETCAPELLQDEGLHDARVDVWAFGCVVYGLATGDYPFGPATNVFQLMQRFDSLERGELPLLNAESMKLLQPLPPDSNACRLITPILLNSLQVDPTDRSESLALLELLQRQNELVHPRSQETVRIFITDMTGERRPVNIKRDATIRELKLRLEGMGHMFANNRLLHQIPSRVLHLEDQHTLQFYNIQDGSTLDVVLATKWCTYDEHETLPKEIEEEVDLLLNQRSSYDPLTPPKSWRTAVSAIVKQVQFYPWTEVQARKISLLTRLHAESKEKKQFKSRGEPRLRFGHLSLSPR